jgi:hypothetical protein
MSQQLRTDHSHTVVDKKIEATISKAEQPTTARSRKASHYLRVFKENDVAEEKKRRDGRGRNHQDDGLGGLDGKDRGFSVSRPSSTLQSPQKGPTHSYFESDLSTPATDVDRQLGTSKVQSPEEPYPDTPIKQEFPLELLKEIRNIGNGNLTPGAAPGASFSKSLPSSAAKHLRQSRATSEEREASDYFQSAEDDGHDHDDDESEKEQISSALYFPHRQLQTSDQVPKKAEVAKAEVEGVRDGKSLVPSRLPKGWSTEAAVKTPEEVEISLQSQDTNQCLHGDMPSTASVPKDIEKSLTSSPEFTTSAGSDFESQAESWHSLAGDEFSATDDLGTTPTPTPRRKERDIKPPPAAQAQPPAPLGAVELKPYDHQVGGHTTVYRFSRRAVCKQLNNRENEFYETVERHHPELLEFLPRYDLFLSFGGLKLKRQRRQTRSPRALPPVIKMCANVMLFI